MKYQSGIDELDQVFEGGFPAGSLVLLFSEGDCSGKTTTLSYLANNSIRAGNSVSYISFDESFESLKQKVELNATGIVSLEPYVQFDHVERLLADLSADVVFIDNLSNIDSFFFIPEAVSVIHNLRTIAMYTQQVIVATVEVFEGQDIIPLLRMTDVAFDIENYQNRAFTLGVLKNRYGRAGFNLNFGVSH